MSGEELSIDPPAQSTASIEESHVHQVYNKIATHFSNTRYSPWPVVSDFLRTRQKGSIGADIGCGNGKYLGVNPDVFIVGSDRSEGLVEIASRERHFEVVLCDGLHTPHAPHTMDFCLCIAVIHHYATQERRVAAIEHILSILRTDEGAEALIYVWALEQKTSRRGWQAGDPQDVMVSWKTNEDGKEVTYQRFYHLYKKGDLERDIGDAGGIVVRSGYDRDNWWAVIRNPNPTMK